MGSFGTLLEIISILSGVISVFFYINALIKDDSTSNKFGNIGFVSQAILSTIASIILVYALAISYFKMEYVAKYTDRSLPFIYKISAFWAGQAGSLLFWGWLITMVGVIELVRNKKFDIKYRSAIMTVITITSTFFFVLTSFVTNPFKELDFIPTDGLGMNPLLQNPGMLYHPPTLYMGYVVYTLPFAYAVASLITGDYSSKWLKHSRIWNIIAWIFLTIGIVLGAQWAYVELGWGGYWAWDPVENASLLPWLTGTALLHSAIMYERINRLKIWTYMLALITFELCIFGTFLTRSGIIDSVHSFAKSHLGIFFIWFIIATGILFLALLILNKKSLKEEGNFYLLSKEGLFFITNWLFVGLMLVIIFGTTLPIISEIFGNKSSVDISYYNKVSTPFFIALLFLAGVCPLIPYKKVNFMNIIKKIWLSGVLSIIVGVVLYVVGYKKIIPLILFMVTTLAFFAIVIQVVANLKKSGFSAFMKNRRFYGSMIIHLGLCMIAFGVIGSSFYKVSTDEVVKENSDIFFNEYQLHVKDLRFEHVENYISAYVPVSVYKDGKYIITMKPERRFYRNSDENAYAEVSIHTTPLGDLYLILASYDKNQGIVGIQAIYHPLVVWIWIGCFVMVFGGVYSLSHRNEDL